MVPKSPITEKMLLPQIKPLTNTIIILGNLISTSVSHVLIHPIKGDVRKLSFTSKCFIVSSKNLQCKTS